MGEHSIKLQDTVQVKTEGKEQHEFTEKSKFTLKQQRRHEMM